MSEEQRKYILSFKEEDPLLMAYVEGQKAAEQRIAEVIAELIFRPNAMRLADKIRSRPYNPEQEKQAAINGVLDQLQEDLSNKITLQQVMLVQNESGFVWWSDIETTINDIRQQTGQTSAEQQRGRGV